MRIEYRTILSVLRRRRGLIALLALATLAQSAIVLVLPYVAKLELELLEARYRGALSALSGSPFVVFAAILALLLVSHVAAVASQAIERLLGTVAEQQLVIETDRVLFEKLTTLDAGLLQNPRNRKLAYIMFDTGELSHATLRYGMSQGRIIVIVCGILPIIALVDLRVFGVLLASSLLQWLVLRARMRNENAYRLFKERELAKIDELRWVLRFFFHQLLNVAGEEKVLGEYWRMRRHAAELEQRQQRRVLRYEVGYRLLEHLCHVAAALFVGFQVLRGELTIGSFTMILLYVGQLQSGLSTINDNIGEWYRLRAVFAQLGFFLNLKPRIRTSGWRTPAEPLLGDVVVEGVSFRYPNLQAEEQQYVRHVISELEITNRRRSIWGFDRRLVEDWEALLEQSQGEPPLVLQDVSCRLARGQLTALVGRNGAGKTTLTNLVFRSYDPTAGSLRLAGTPLEQLPPRWIRQHVAVVTQQPFVLDAFSLRDNLLLGVEREVADGQLWEVLETIDLARAVRDLPRGLDTLVADEVNLSGGQSQLLVIGRVILQRRPYIILDEGTNQLDAEHELAILDALERLKSEAAILIITHRMTTARRADTIYVLDDGRIAEAGSHDELLAREAGLYRRFWEIQVVS